MRKIKLLLFGVVLAALLALPSAAMAKRHDRDHDKMPDKWERHHGLSTHRANANGDPDHDGLSNLGEFRSRTNPRDADTNNNGVKDGAEDRDHDGVDNQDEMTEHTNPSDADTDNDGVEDGNEVAGTIVSFEEDPMNPGTGRLTIKLADDSTISGLVNSSTECKTEGANEGPGRAERHGADDGPNHDANDDNGNDANDVNDDNGNDANDDDACSAAELAAGTGVHKAELQGTGDQAVFTEIKLVK